LGCSVPVVLVAAVGGGDGGGDGRRDRRVGGSAAARPGAGPRRERTPASSPGGPLIAVDAAGLGAPRSEATRAETRASMTTPHAWAAPWTLTTPSTGGRGQASGASRDPARPLGRVPTATRTEAGGSGDLGRPGGTARGGAEGRFLRGRDRSACVGAKLCNGTINGCFQFG